jgi:transketolase
MMAIDVHTLEETAARIRLHLIQMFSYGKAHHFGGSLSCTDILTALYFYKMNYSKENMQDPGRDRFIMSKGHSVPTQYVILSMLGILEKEELKSIKTLGSRLQGHPDIHKTPGLEAPTGSLGMGLSYANGLALAARYDSLTFNIFLVVGDGELQEGQNWEAAMTTAHYGLTNVCVIVDYNKFQSQGCTDDMMCLESLVEKWEAFGWEGVEVDGHSMDQLCSALDKLDGRNDRPVAIVANTVKGKGVSFLENTFKYHNYNLTEEEYAQAEKELLEKLSQF